MDLESILNDPRDIIAMTRSITAYRTASPSYAIEPGQLGIRKNNITGVYHWDTYWSPCITPGLQPEPLEWSAPPPTALNYTLKASILLSRFAAGFSIKPRVDMTSSCAFLVVKPVRVET